MRLEAWASQCQLSPEGQQDFLGVAGGEGRAGAGNLKGVFRSLDAEPEGQRSPPLPLGDDMQRAAPNN